MTRRHFSRSSLLAVCLLVGLSISRGATISLGIDELEKTNFAALKGKRIGLVTNPSGADSKGRSAIDVLYRGQNAGGYQLVKLFGPEHGIDGLTGAGKEFNNGRDPKTNLPVYALYNTPTANHRHPTREMFSGLDAVVYDVQDLGNRSYTFISTLGYVMDECAKDNIECIVLDRPNPLGGVRIEGPRLDPTVSSFVGLYNIPYVYGLTPGELAQWINAKYLTNPCRLTIVAMRGWTRPMVWEDTGLKWIPTSPNIPTIGAARGYTFTGVLGEIGIETGIGGPVPFEAVAGHGWPDATIAKRFSALHIPGVKFTPYHYYAGGNYDGVLIKVDPRNAGNLTAINFYAIEILEHEVDGFSAFGHTSADQKQMFQKVTGVANMRQQLQSGRPVSDIVESWDAGVAEWAQERLPYLLYSNTAPKSSASPAPAPAAIPGTMATGSATP
jgi:uncharacterized protein YbbC (DUF1343 family)